MSEPRFEELTLVVLRRPPDAPDLAEPELEANHAQHLAHLQAMRARGALVAAGPFRERPDESWRGLCVYRVGADEARELAALDPAVQCGRFAVDLLTWLVPAADLPIA